jgi:hypothetical protein
LAATYAIIGKKDVGKSILDQAEKILILTQNQAIPLVQTCETRQSYSRHTFSWVTKRMHLLAHHIERNWEITVGMPPLAKLMEFGVASYLNKYPTAKNIVATYSIRGKSYNVNQEGSSYFIKFDKKLPFLQILL